MTREEAILCLKGIKNYDYVPDINVGKMAESEDKE